MLPRSLHIFWPSSNNRLAGNWLVRFHTSKAKQVTFNYHRAELEIRSIVMTGNSFNEAPLLERLLGSSSSRLNRIYPGNMRLFLSYCTHNAATIFSNPLIEWLLGLYCTNSSMKKMQSPSGGDIFLVAEFPDRCHNLANKTPRTPFLSFEIYTSRLVISIRLNRPFEDLVNTGWNKWRSRWNVIDEWF